MTYAVVILAFLLGVRFEMFMQDGYFNVTGKCAACNSRKDRFMTEEK